MCLKCFKIVFLCRLVFCLIVTVVEHLEAPVLGPHTLSHSLATATNVCSNCLRSCVDVGAHWRKKILKDDRFSTRNEKCETFLSLTNCHCTHGVWNTVV